MVSSWFSDLTSKGAEWFYGTSSSSTTPAHKKETDEPSWASDDYWSYATSSFQSVVDTTSATLSSVANTALYYTTSSSPEQPQQSPPAEQQNMQQQQTTRYPWMFQKNPYRNIRGQYDQPSSLSAVRSLLIAVHVDTEQTTPEELLQRESSSSLEASSVENQPVVSRSETASQLAEGTVRALRDLELDEAMELHVSLKYWTKRWERPLLSWLEAGPWVWFSGDGYNHQLIGQRVAQIQAVLARRCAAIGELQQHLLREGWQQGVAQWGVLGQGGQWAAVAGFDGAMEDSTDNKPLKHHNRRLSTQELEVLPMPDVVASSNADARDSLNAPLYYGHASVFVRKTYGGTILMEDKALAAWSVDAIRVIRDQLYRAGIGLVPLPFPENWAGNDAGLLIAEGIESTSTQLPVWASREKKAPSARTSESELATIIEEQTDDASGSQGGIDITAESQEEGQVVITDLNAMAAEVSELLDTMEVVIDVQRKRRLDKLKGLPLLRRRWYVSAMSGPLVVYLAYRLLLDGTGTYVAGLVWDKMSEFFKEHIYIPMRAIFAELFTREPRDTISDRKARLDAIKSLKKMIRSFLDETFDAMDEAERKARADNMDMSLIEQKKEENMKTILEINSVVRMSLIEMQFIKKELLNALYAIDEMMTSNEINMNIAAVTPAVLMFFGVNKFLRFLIYVLLKVKRSRAERHATFRHVLLDIERLLVMRDNPPSAPPPLKWTEDGQPETETPAPEQPHGPSVLNSDDLGMLMLHIHECRTILWEDRRNMSSSIMRDIHEDLAELAGERGPVSVQQQLQIVERMFRTYSFLKVISLGIPVL